MVNPAGIRTQAPGLSKSPEDLGGVLVVVLYHEIKHADGSYSGRCGEVSLQLHTAGQHCDFICFLTVHAPSTSLADLCHYYAWVRNRYNAQASADWASHGCSGPFPGQIPFCSCCP